MGSAEGNVMTDNESGGSDEKVIPFAKPQQKRQGSSGSTKPPPGQGQDTEGLAAGYWRQDGAVWTTTRSKPNPRALRLCSDMKAIHAESDPDGNGWALNVDVVDARGVHKLVRFTRADAEIRRAACACSPTPASLSIPTKRSAIALFSTLLFARKSPSLTASSRRVERRLTITMFALPTGVTEADGKKAGTSIVVWRGDSRHGRARQGGKREGSLSEVAHRAEKVPLAMSAIGVMLSGPALPYLPPENEANTMEHLVGESGKWQDDNRLRRGQRAWEGLANDRSG
jgi:hypothetical protein